MLPVLLYRALRKRCPRCGSRGLFTSWSRMVAACPGCGLDFDREEGYFLGAMTVNLAVTEFVFLVVFVGGMLLTWPDVPWTTLLVASVAVNIVTPIVFYPFAKTTWLALDVGFLQRLEPGPADDRDHRNPP